MRLKQRYPLKLICECIGLSRSSYYYQASAKDPKTRLRRAIEEIAEDWPKYGYRRVREQLERSQITVGKEQVRKLMKDAACNDGLTAQDKEKVCQNDKQQS